MEAESLFGVKLNYHHSTFEAWDTQRSFSKVVSSWKDPDVSDFVGKYIYIYLVVCFVCCFFLLVYESIGSYDAVVAWLLGKGGFAVQCVRSTNRTTHSQQPA